MGISQFIHKGCLLFIKKWKCSKQGVKVLTSIVHEQAGLNVSLKLSLILYSHRLLKPNPSLVNIFIPNESVILNVFLLISLVNFSNPLRNTI